MTKRFALATSVALVVVDQLIKIWAQAVLAEKFSITVIPNLFYLTYVRNYGAAFGILYGRTSLLTVLVGAVLIAGIYLIVTERIKRPFVLWSVCLVIAGGAGNLVDRILYGYVVDYLDFSALFGFPVFNFADCCVVIGTFLILFYVLFLDRSEQQAEKQAGEASSDSDKAKDIQ